MSIQTSKYLSALLLLCTAHLAAAEPVINDRAALSGLQTGKGLFLVGDGFISLIGYQAQGYHLVPVF